MTFLGLDGRSYAAGLNTSVAQAKVAGEKISDFLGSKLKSSLMAIGSALALKHLISEAAELGEKAKDIHFGSERLDVDQQRFQQLQRAAEKYHSSIGTIFTAYKKMAVGSVEALDGSLELRAAWSQLGISMDDLRKKSIDDIFAKISHKLAGAEVDGRKLAALIKVMGRSADELIPAFKHGAFEGANPFAIPDENLKSLEDFKKNLGVFKSVFQVVKDTALARMVSTTDEGFAGAGILSKSFAKGAKALKKIFGIQDIEFGPKFKSSGELKAMAAAELEEQKKAKEHQTKMDHEVLKEKERLEKEVFEQKRKNFLDTLTDENKLVALMRERAFLAKQIADSKEDVATAKLRLEQQKVNSEILDVAQKKRHLGGINTTQLQKVGAFISSDPFIKLESLSKEQTKYLKEIRDSVKKNNTNIRKGVAFK